MGARDGVGTGLGDGDGLGVVLVTVFWVLLELPALPLVPPETLPDCADWMLIFLSRLILNVMVRLRLTDRQVKMLTEPAPVSEIMTKPGGHGNWLGGGGGLSWPAVSLMWLTVVPAVVAAA